MPKAKRKYVIRNREKYCQARKASLKRQWQDPEFRQKIIDGHLKKLQQGN